MDILSLSQVVKIDLDFPSLLTRLRTSSTFEFALNYEQFSGDLDIVFVERTSTVSKVGMLLWVCKVSNSRTSFTVTVISFSVSLAFLDVFFFCTDDCPMKHRSYTSISYFQ